jgi:hypothetical protein
MDQMTVMMFIIVKAHYQVQRMAWHRQLESHDAIGPPKPQPL